MKRLLVPTSALFWGLQFAFLNPVLALLLVSLFDASAAQVGWSLAIYNASGFLASLLIPAWADRRGEYLRPMLLCGVFTLVLAGALAVTTSLPVAVVALVVLGGPAGVGSSLLFAHLKASGARPSDVVNTRAVVSFAWVAGPPLATVIMGALGNRSILIALAVVAVLNVATALVTMAAQRDDGEARSSRQAQPEDDRPVPRAAVIAIVIAFIALQATNSAAVSVMSLFVTDRLGLPLIWSGIALGVSALLEIPALLAIGRLSRRFSGNALVITGCLAGILYYTAMTFVRDPITLIALQVLNAWFFAVVAGVGLTMFQQIIPRPGLASGLFTNTRRVGAIVSGPIIGFGSATAFGYQGIFAVCAALTVVALLIAEIARRISRRAQPSPTRPARRAA
ncbi:MFS transporter [Humibacter sp. RRB41]|uniref:MFS transporter n=1 Tax=Humibacter sp. RRB41 TaxID=2919946 RepID=UPI001FA979F7|nr:MFS transporter [Humibacter sp. RRB41]